MTARAAFLIKTEWKCKGMIYLDHFYLTKMVFSTISKTLSKCCVDAKLSIANRLLFLLCMLLMEGFFSSRVLRQHAKTLCVLSCLFTDRLIPVAKLNIPYAYPWERGPHLTRKTSEQDFLLDFFTTCGLNNVIAGLLFGEQSEKLMSLLSKRNVR